MTANVIDELEELELESPSHFTRAADERVNWVTSIPFFLVHALPLLWFVTGITWTAVALFFVTYFGRMFFLTATYHRYFSHKSFRLNRAWQFFFAFAGGVGGTEGSVVVGRASPQPSQVLRHRTRYPLAQARILVESRGLDPLRQVRRDGVRQHQGFRELPRTAFPQRARLDRAMDARLRVLVHRRVERSDRRFFASTVLLWHTTFLVNSLAHVMGRRPYKTEDTSKNSLLIALVTGGEGWHNNHHRYQSAARQGFRWWQIDTTYYGLWLLSRVGIVRDLRPVPARVIDEARPTR